MATCPALLVMTSRTEGDPLDPAWQKRARGSQLTTIDLGPLRREEALAMAQTLLRKSDDFAASLRGTSCGNPAVPGTAPMSCRGQRAGLERAGFGAEPRQARTDRLDLADKQALQAASVLGQRFEADDVGLYPRPPGLHTRVPIAHRLVRPQGEAFLFSHALVRTRSTIPC